MHVITDDPTMSAYGREWWNVLYGDREHARTKSDIIHYERAREIVGRGSVLDVGCGEAWFSQYVDGLYVGVDWSQTVIDRARERYSDRVFVCCDYIDMVGKVECDWVCTFEVFEHVPDPKRFIDSLLLMSKHGVVFVLPCGPFGQRIVRNDKAYLSALGLRHQYHYATYDAEDVLGMWPEAKRICVDCEHLMFVVNRANG